MMMMMMTSGDVEEYLFLFSKKYLKKSLQVNSLNKSSEHDAARKAHKNLHHNPLKLIFTEKMYMMKYFF